jgi:hypothetical protein
VKTSRWADSDEDDEEDWEKPQWLVALLEMQQKALQPHEKSSLGELCLRAEVKLVADSMPLQVMDWKTEACGKSDPFKTSSWIDSDEDDEEDWDKPEWLVSILEMQQKALPLQNARASTEVSMVVGSPFLPEPWAHLDDTAAPICIDFESAPVCSRREALTHLEDARNRLYDYLTGLGDAAYDRRLRALENPLVVLETAIADDLRKSVGCCSHFESKLEDCLEEEVVEDGEDEDEDGDADEHETVYKYNHEDEHEDKHEDEDEDEDEDDDEHDHEDEHEDEHDHEHDYDYEEERKPEKTQDGGSETAPEAGTQVADVSDAPENIFSETSSYLAYYGYEAADFLAQARCQLHNHMTGLGRSNYERKLMALEYPHIVQELPEWEARPKAVGLRGASHWLDDGRAGVSSSNREAPQIKRNTKATKAQSLIMQMYKRQQEGDSNAQRGSIEDHDRL